MIKMGGLTSIWIANVKYRTLIYGNTRPKVIYFDCQLSIAWTSLTGCTSCNTIKVVHSSCCSIQNVAGECAVSCESSVGNCEFQERKRSICQWYSIWSYRSWRMESPDEVWIHYMGQKYITLRPAARVAPYIYPYSLKNIKKIIGVDFKTITWSELNNTSLISKSYFEFASKSLSRIPICD